jgi:hypothetical protein
MFYKTGRLSLVRPFGHSNPLWTTVTHLGHSNPFWATVTPFWATGRKMGKKPKTPPANGSKGVAPPRY